MSILSFLIIVCFFFINEVVSGFVYCVWLKPRLKIFSPILFASIVVGVTLLTYLYTRLPIIQPNTFRTACVLAAQLILIFTLYSAPWFKKLIVFFSINMFKVIIEMLVYFPLNLFGTSVQMQMTEPATYIKVSCIICIILTVGQILIAVMSKKGRLFIASAELKEFTFFPISQLLALTVFMLAFYQLANVYTIFGLMMCAIIFIFADVHFYRVFRKYNERRLFEEKSRLLERQLEIQIDHYEAFADLEEEMRFFNHDVRNQLQVINGLIEHDEMDEAKEVSEQLEAQIGSFNRITFSRNKIINALLYSKLPVMRNMDIDFKHDLSINDSINIQKYDLCSAFSNVLDNAIEACERALTADPNIKCSIELSCREINDYFCVKCTNTSLSKKEILNINRMIIPSEESKEQADDKNQDEEYMSGIRQVTKSRTCGRGSGLRILRRLAEEYNGDLIAEQKEREFETTLLLQH